MPFLVRRNGRPTVVIYTGTTDQEEVKTILEEFIRVFPESDAIGLCELGDPQRIPYGNIRLNKLICFAKGDRGMKLEKVHHNRVRMVIKSNDITKKNIPAWILKMRSNCNPPDEVNKKSQHFFGVDICDEKYSKLNSLCTAQPFCYLSPTVDCLDPNTIKGLEIIEKPKQYPSGYNPIGSVPQRALTVVNHEGGRKRTRKLRKKTRTRKSHV